MLFNKLNKGRKQGGMTLIETAVVFAIVGFAMFQVIKYYGKISNNATSQSDTREVISVSSNVKNMYAASSSYAGLTMAAAINNKVFPDDRATPGGTTASNSDGGSITLAATTLTNANDAVKMSYTNVAQDKCLTIVPNIQTQFKKVVVGGTVVKDDVTNVAFNVATLGTACTAAANVQIDYYFSK